MFKSNVISGLILTFTCLTSGLTHAQEWSYIDVTDPLQQGGINTFNSENNQPNSWAMGEDGDASTTRQWRFRENGPGVPAWRGTAYTGRYIDGDPALHTKPAKLTPEGQYEVRVYGVYPSNPSSRFGAEFSLDGGQTWTMVDNKDWSILTWVDNSTELGEAFADQTPSGDTRFYIQLPGVMTADAGGIGRIDLRLPESISNGTSQDKFNIDGYALREVVAAAPEAVYIDVTDPLQQGGINTFNVSNGQPNSWAMGSDGDAATTQQWRYRDTGPGAPAWNGTAYTGRFIDGDPSLYTVARQLEANAAYEVRVYGVFPSNPSSRFGAEFSVDGGTTWTMVDNKDWSLLTWVDNSSELGEPLAEQTPSGDSRFYIQLPGVMITDGEGNGRVDLRLPESISNGTSQDKFNIDGYAFIPSSAPAPAGFDSFELNPDGTLTLSWSGGAELQSTTNLNAPAWTTISGATSPHTVATDGESAFFRLAP